MARARAHCLSESTILLNSFMCDFKKEHFGLATGGEQECMTDTSMPLPRAAVTVNPLERNGKDVQIHIEANDI